MCLIPSFRQNASEASPPPEGRRLREKHTKHTQPDPPTVPSRYRGIKRDTQVSAVDQATRAEDGGSTPCARGCRRSSCGLEVSDIGDVGHARGCGGICCGPVRGHQPLLHARWACDHIPEGHAAGQAYSWWTVGGLYRPAITLPSHPIRTTPIDIVNICNGVASGVAAKCGTVW